MKKIKEEKEKSENASKLNASVMTNDMAKTLGAPKI